MAAWMTILLLLVLGFILLLMELFIIPGFGLVGISGLILLFVASYLSFKTLNILVGLVLSIGSFILVIILIRFFADKLSNLVSLKEKEDAERGFRTSTDYANLSGKEGESITSLRPSGMALIDGKKFSVVTEGMFIAKGIKIKVVRVEGGKIFVRKGG